jgi:hypothetical protein
MATPKTPAARALVGALALRSGATTNQAFKLAGYHLVPTHPDEQAKHWADRSQRADRRNIVRGWRFVAVTNNAGHASQWLDKLGRKLEALGVGKAAA